jgi:hypothetical protein
MLSGQFEGFDPSALDEHLDFEPLGDATLWAESGELICSMSRG